jgi:Flagellar biosynthesis protein, FliO
MWTATAEKITATPWKRAEFWRSLWRGLSAALGKVRVQKKTRSLRIQETLPLGERRYLAVVQWDNEKLLLGVTPQSISLLKPHAKKGTPGFVWEEERRA